MLDSVSFNCVQKQPEPDQFLEPNAEPHRLSWVVNDGTLNSAAQSTTVNITASYDNAPVLGNVALSRLIHGWSSNFIAGCHCQRCRQSEPRLGDGIDHQRVLDHGDTLAATITGTSITASYSASTGVLSGLSAGSDTLAHYQQVLDSVSYSSTLTQESEGQFRCRSEPYCSLGW